MEELQVQSGQHSSVDFTAQTDTPLLIRTCLVAGAVSLNLSGYSLNVNCVC